MTNHGIHTALNVVTVLEQQHLEDTQILEAQDVQSILVIRAAANLIDIDRTGTHLYSYRRQRQASFVK